MCSAGANLRPDHTVAAVAPVDDASGLNRFSETRPPTPAVELVHRRKQRFARNHINVKTWFFVVPIRILKGMFGGVFLRDLELLRRKAREGFRVLAITAHNLHYFGFPLAGLVADTSADRFLANRRIPWRCGS